MRPTPAAHVQRNMQIKGSMTEKNVMRISQLWNYSQSKDISAQKCWHDTRTTNEGVFNPWYKNVAGEIKINGKPSTDVSRCRSYLGLSRNTVMNLSRDTNCSIPANVPHAKGYSTCWKYSNARFLFHRRRRHIHGWLQSYVISSDLAVACS